jgi:hypothetical protein
MASFISSWHSAMAFSILCGAVAGDRHLFYLTKRAEIITIRCKNCFVIPCRLVNECKLIIDSIYFNLIQVLISLFNYKIGVRKHGVKSCRHKVLMERQTADRCICVLIISACLQCSSVTAKRRLNLLAKFQQLRAEKAKPRFLLCVLRP